MKNIWSMNEMNKSPKKDNLDIIKFFYKWLIFFI